MHKCQRFSALAAMGADYEEELALLLTFVLNRWRASRSVRVDDGVAKPRRSGLRASPRAEIPLVWIDVPYFRRADDLPLGITRGYLVAFGDVSRANPLASKPVEVSEFGMTPAARARVAAVKDSTDDHPFTDF